MTATATGPAPPVGPSRHAPAPVLRSARAAAVVGGATLGTYVVLALLGRRIAPFRATELAGMTLESPGGRHLLGTNLLGQDIASQLVLGARASLFVAVLAGAGTVAVGGVVGVLAGWFPGWPAAVLMRITDLVLVVPKLPLLLLVGALTGGSVVG
ncbi:MAG: ABC transporter permease, partial [Acidimicrobiales bacterium]